MVSGWADVSASAQLVVCWQRSFVAACPFGVADSRRVGASALSRVRPCRRERLMRGDSAAPPLRRLGPGGLAAIYVAALGPPIDRVVGESLEDACCV
jgi:hypothetical protein